MRTDHIKSFVLRQGKITIGQKKALEDLLPVYGIDFNDQPIDLHQVFGNSNPVIIEIGFGMGHATLEIAKNNPQNNYLGIEVHGPGVGALLMQIEKEKLSNLKIIQYDAIMVLKHMIKEASITGFHIFFPDPWHKKRHHKRRIIQKNFIDLLCTKLIPNGYIHIATDWEDYANWILDIIKGNNKLVKQEGDQKDTFGRPTTKFENRGLKLGHGIWDLKFCLIFSKN